MNIPKWVKEFYDEWGFYPICGGKTSSKSKKAEQTAAQQRQTAEQQAGLETQAAATEAERRLAEAGKTARSQLLTAGEPSPEETSRLARYRGKALTPAETLMTEAGPISQAVARRIQERVERPGLEYERDLPAYVQGVSEPLWRSLKARGIAPPPGTEGGGLGTQQFMKGAEPALAELRAKAVSEDISRGEEYGVRARELQNLWTEIESILGEAIRGRQYVAGVRGAEAEQLGVREGAPYGVKGAEAKGAGFTEAARINQEEVNARYARKREENKAIGASIGKIIGTLLLATPAAPAGAAMIAGSEAYGGGTPTPKTDLASSLSTRRQPTLPTEPSYRLLQGGEMSPAVRQLASRTKGWGGY